MCARRREPATKAFLPEITSFMELNFLSGATLLRISLSVLQHKQSRNSEKDIWIHVVAFVEYKCPSGGLTERYQVFSKCLSTRRKDIGLHTD